MPPSNLAEIERVIKIRHGCESKYIGSRTVTEKFRGNIAWTSSIDVFRLKGHAKAERCYGWQYRDGGATKTVTVLKIPPIRSAEAAVRFAESGSGF
jgi:hypothetical protein